MAKRIQTAVGDVFVGTLVMDASTYLDAGGGESLKPTRTIMFRSNSGATLSWKADAEYFVIEFACDAANTVLSTNADTTASEVAGSTRPWTTLIAYRNSLSKLRAPLHKDELLCAAFSTAQSCSVVLELA